MSWRLRDRPMGKEKAAASGLKKHLGFWMRVVSNQVSHAFARKLEASGVTVAEWVVLGEMYGSGKRTAPSVVAELTGLSRGAVSKLISRLLEKGLVTRRESRTDRRYQDIALTKAAIALVPTLAKLADENDQEFFGVISKAERETLRAILQRVVTRHKLTTVPIE